jgi:hypothetical protein
MSKPNDGGPAFPCTDAKGFTSEGMSLRDYFAGQALAGMDTDGYTLIGMQSIVQRAYCLADAMLDEREKERA